MLRCHGGCAVTSKLYGADVIYLATDSLASSAACRHWTGFKCIVMNSELRSAIDGDQAEIHERQDINHVDIALFAIADLRTLQEFGDVFVGESCMSPPWTLQATSQSSVTNSVYTLSCIHVVLTTCDLFVYELTNSLAATGTHSSDFSEDAHALIRQRKGWNVPFIYMNVKTQIGKATHTLDT